MQCMLNHFNFFIGLTSVNGNAQTPKLAKLKFNFLSIFLALIILLAAVGCRFYKKLHTRYPWRLPSKCLVIPNN